ncbi:Ger(x)C family spore germination protein [Paenibacillus sp. NPDC056579]|uniref:Ger(x)C family spore germination protein n=1 Tax=Paenibacillus sp. NPDC056579 TaxID=3345871 RepID=UPI0036CB33B5
MMRRVGMIVCMLAALVLTGCSDRLNVEDLTLSLMLGIDLDKDNQLVYFLSSPVFNKEAAIKSEEIAVHSETLYQARSKFDLTSTGLTIGGKIQVLLLGKSLLQHEDWFPLIDIVYRNAKVAVNARVVVVDGPVADIINFHPSDKPRLSLHILKLIDTADQRNITLKTTLQELHRQMFEKGVTPSMSEIKKEKAVEVMGTALLNERGKYVDKLMLQESALLKILQHKELDEMMFTIAIPEKDELDVIPDNKLTLTPSTVKTLIKPSYSQGRFRFDITVNILYSLTERLFPFNVKEERPKLERWINEQMEQQFHSIFDKMQKHRIDPVGLGLYARAYEYQHWKEVQDHWGDALADAVINIKVKTEIKSMGPIK